MNRPFYDTFGWAYDAMMDAPIANKRAFIAHVLGQHGIGAGSRLLDAGCGTGNYALALAQRGYHVTGIDTSEALLAVAQHKANARVQSVQFVRADMLTVAFAAPFNGIVRKGGRNPMRYAYVPQCDAA